MIETIKSYDLAIDRVNKVIKSLKAYPRILDQEENKYLHPVFDKALYNALTASDLIVGLKYLDVSNAMKNGYEANYFARTVAHCAYEVLHYKHKLIGKDAATILKSRLGDAALKSVKESIANLKSVQKDHFEKLDFIRNNLFGHRNESGLATANGMLEIDNKLVYQIGKAVFDALIVIISVITALLSKL